MNFQMSESDSNATASDFDSRSTPRASRSALGVRELLGICGIRASRKASSSSTVCGTSAEVGGTNGHLWVAVEQYAMMRSRVYGTKSESSHLHRCWELGSCTQLELGADLDVPTWWASGSLESQVKRKHQELGDGVQTHYERVLEKSSRSRSEDAWK